MDIAEYRSYARFDAADEARLRELWPSVEPELEPIVVMFYERVLEHQTTRSIISDPAQVRRLQDTLKVWLRELLNGPWDEAYASRRRRIGLVHVDVGVSHAAMFMAMSAVSGALGTIAARAFEHPAAVLDAVRKVTMLDLGLMSGSYHSTREEQSSREARALLVSHLPAVALLLNEDGVIQSATAAAGWLFGSAAGVGAHYLDVLPIDNVEGEGMNRFFERALASGNDVKLPRVDAVINNEPCHLSATFVPFADSEVGAILYVENHTVAVESERRAQKAEHLAQIGTLSATIAHELRNPLAGISGALQVIAVQFADNQRLREIIDKILDQVRGLNRLVTDLLAYARPDRLQKKDGIDLEALCAEVFENAREDYPDVEYHLCGAAQAAVDPQMIRQVLLNLVLNACQAMNGTGVLTIEVTGDHITVCDSGPGLPETVQRRMYEPFFTTKLKGTGLGLSISLKVARAMGGDLELIEDSPLGGACFRLWIRRPSAP